MASDILSLFDAGRRLHIDAAEVLRLARNGDLGLVEPVGDESWFGVRVTSDSVREYQAKQDRLRREIDQLEADLDRDVHPSHSRVEPQYGVPVSLIGPWRDHDEHPEFVVVWVALAGFFAAGFLTGWWLT